MTIMVNTVCRKPTSEVGLYEKDFLTENALKNSRYFPLGTSFEPEKNKRVEVKCVSVSELGFKKNDSCSYSEIVMRARGKGLNTIPNAVFVNLLETYKTESVEGEFVAVKPISLEVAPLGFIFNLRNGNDVLICSSCCVKFFKPDDKFLFMVIK